MIHDTIESNTWKVLEHHQSKVEFANMNLRLQGHLIHIVGNFVPSPSYSLPAESYKVIVLELKSTKSRPISYYPHPLGHIHPQH